MRFVIAIVFMLLLVGCSEPRIDTSSESALQASLPKVRESLPSDQRAEFDALVAKAGFASAVSGSFSNTPVTFVSIFEPYNGKTGPEFIAAVRKAEAEAAANEAAEEAERVAREAAKEAEELAKLESVEKAHLDAIERLRKIAITDPVTEHTKKHYRSEYKLGATVHNGMDVALSSISFDYDLRSPDRAVPWAKGDGYFFIRGGLEPGEQRTLDASGTEYGGFITLLKAIEEHPDAALTLHVTDARGADEKSILPAELTTWSAARLKELRDKKR